MKSTLESLNKEMNLFDVLKHLSEKAQIDFTDTCYEFQYHDEGESYEVPNVFEAGKFEEPFTKSSSEDEPDPLEVAKNLEAVEKVIYSK